MSYNNSNQGYQGYQSFQGYQGVQINLKPQPQDMGLSQLGYSNPPPSSQLGYSNPNPNLPSPFNKVIDFFSPRKPQSTLLFENVSIISKKAQKVLDVCQDKDRFGMLIIYEDFTQSNQRFDIVKVGEYVNIINKKSGKTLTIGGNSQRNGVPVFQQPMSNLVGQKFRLAQLQKNEYLIHTFCGKVLDCCEEKTSNGTSVIQWKCDRKQHQIWLIK